VGAVTTCKRLSTHLIHDQDLRAHEDSTGDAEELTEAYIEVRPTIFHHCIEAIGKRLDYLVLDIHLES